MGACAGEHRHGDRRRTCRRETVEPPDALSTLTGTLNSDGSITLNWTGPERQVTGCRIMRRRPSLGESSMVVYAGETGKTHTTFATYTDASVTGDGDYGYRVKAINSAGVGPRSNFAKFDR